VSAQFSTLAVEMSFSPPSAVYDRPKTSRGKARPSPDEFFDYVVPSPSQPERSNFNNPSLMVFSDGKNQNLSQSRGVSHREKEKSRKEQEEQAGMERERRDQIRMLGCWLFGTALRV
jgi:hypothetical protein